MKKVGAKGRPERTLKEALAALKGAYAPRLELTLLEPLPGAYAALILGPKEPLFLPASLGPAFGEEGERALKALLDLTPRRFHQPLPPGKLAVLEAGDETLLKRVVAARRPLYRFLA